MIKAIVYNSNTGFTKKYAEMLSKSINIPCYEIEKAHYVLDENDEIIFMTWLLAKRLKGLKHYKRVYNVRAVCAIGLTKADEDNVKEIAIANNLKQDLPLFYLRGGMDVEKLTGFYKFIITQVAKSTEKKDTEEDSFNSSVGAGADYVDENNLQGIIDWYKSETEAQ